MGNELPIIRLDLELFKQSIHHAVLLHNTDLTSYIDKTLEKVIDEFDYESIVEQVASEALKHGVESYFKFGHGRTIIETAIQEALDEAFGGGKSG